MCLSSLTKTEQPSTLIESGWKYFEGNDRSQFPHNYWNSSRDCPLDKWITATGSDIRADAGGSYKAGFHIFTNEAAAKKKKGLRRVYFRRAVAQGVDQSIDAVVAQEMFVPAEENAWPPKEK